MAGRAPSIASSVGSKGAQVASAGYTTVAVAHVLGVTESQVRTYIRSGFVHPQRGPRNEYRFSFQDIVVLRAAQGLVQSEIPKAKVVHALQKLQSSLPAGRSLTALKIYADGGEVVARSGDEVWEAESGQLLFDFEVGDLAETVMPLAREASRRVHEQSDADDPDVGTDDFSAEDWFSLGVEWEATAFDEAKSAYRRALLLREGHAESHLNLGRLLHEEGELRDAERHYRRAHELDPHDVTPIFNLGVVLQDQRMWSEAIAAYEGALELAPDSRDVYFNLATLYEATGDKAAAIRSLKIYKRLSEE